MPNPKATSRKQRLQSMVDSGIYDRVLLLAEQEQRSESHMSAILIEEALDSREVPHVDQPKVANA